MACILTPDHNFVPGYFRCLLPIETVNVEVKVKMMRDIHIFRKDSTTQVISCKPWSPLSLYTKKDADLPGARRQE